MSCYVSLQQMRQGLNIVAKVPQQAEKTPDETLLRLAEAASEMVDRHCGRTFRTYQGARVYSPVYRNLLLVDDLLTLTALKTDLDYDGVFERTWAATDYYLDPANAPLDGEPYTRIRTRTGGVETFPTEIEKSVEVTGTWGYSDTRDLLPTTVSGAHTASDTVITVSDIDEIEVGNTLRIGSEQVYVRARDLTLNQITVRRAQNSTTAAAIVDGTAIEVYRYPEGVSTAAQMHAGRIYRRLETPLGIVNVPGDIGWRAVYIPRFDTDVREMLSDYRKANWFR